MKHEDHKKLLFIYNANSGIRNAILDTAHKIVSPGTYECNLCDITFGLLGEKRAWRKFREHSGIPMEFLHKDEFRKQYASKFGHKYVFPAVLCEGESALSVLVPSDELNKLRSPQELIGLLEERWKTL